MPDSTTPLPGSSGSSREPSKGSDGSRTLTAEDVAERELAGGDILFIGLGTTAVCWYRCALPAMFLGADWVGVVGTPPKVGFATGLVKGGTRVPVFSDYKVVVIQQPAGRGWLSAIRELQGHGVKVVYEIDDYLHGVKNVEGHDFRRSYGKKELAELELCMRVCDAMICSTEFLARRYRKFNPRTYVCPNGLDMARYDLTLPERAGMTTIGWAGATGHDAAVMPWLEEVARVMRARDDTAFVSIGQPYARELAPEFGWSRCLAVPFTMLDSYPAAMTHFDVALAPAGRSIFHRGKSDLRWVEASALGIPTIADPALYPEIKHGVTGLHAPTAAAAGAGLDALLDSPRLRRELGAKARADVRARRGMDSLRHRWAEVLGALVD